MAPQAILRVLLLRCSHRDAHATFSGNLRCPFVAGIHVADDAHARVIGQQRFQLRGSQLAAISQGNLACVDGTAHAYAAAVVDRDP